MDRKLEEPVRARAEGRCEYCHFPRFPFHFEHIIARKHGGPTNEGNLALSCVRCNFHKGPNLSGIDPATSSVVQLFHPRKDEWTRHFHWNGALLIGLAPTARATNGVPAINLPVRMEARAALMAEGQFRQT
jgi:hypothetical protein